MKLYAKINDIEKLVCANKAKIYDKVKTSDVAFKESDLEK